MVDVGHADALRLLLDRVLGLLLRADEEDGAVPLRKVVDERVRLLEEAERLLEVDDVDAAALGEDEALHLRVPAAGLVAEVNPGLQKLSHAYDRHGLILSFGCGRAPAGVGWNRRSRSAGSRSRSAGSRGRADTATRPFRRVGV